MKVASFRLSGIRCFEDTGQIDLSHFCNIFVGKNNSGKSTLMQGITSWQIRPFDFAKDRRIGNHAVQRINIIEGDCGNHLINVGTKADIINLVYDRDKLVWNDSSIFAGSRSLVFKARWPSNAIIPFFAKRKTAGFAHGISLNEQSNSDGTFVNLYARIDRVVSPGSAAHDMYKKAVEEIIGVFITTIASSAGKEAGFYLDDENFVPLDQMGDGIAEIVALIVELSISKDKVFVLEEPETNLHPGGLKSLMSLIRKSSEHNQFIIATHSNIVVRELASESTKIFRVYRENNDPRLPSNVTEVQNTPEAHRDLLRELGYEFSDFGLHETWLFLEESSAETIFQKFLIPWFAPGLVGRLRTFSAAGADNLEPSVSEFQRLVAFIHLHPVYRDRLWVRADGDEKGRKVISEIHKKFEYLGKSRATTFNQEQFESYYPLPFVDEIAAVLSMQNKKDRRAAKATLLRKVVEWTEQNADQARAAWEASASELIDLLRQISSSLPNY